MRHYIPRMYVPGTTTLLLTEARKMPCASWSLPAREACPFAFYAKGAICASCYADKGSYTQYPGVKKAQRARFAWVRECLKSDAGVDTFVSTMVAVIRRAGNPYFRVHDSGDLFSRPHMGMVTHYKRCRTSASGFRLGRGARWSCPRWRRLHVSHGS